MAIRSVTAVEWGRALLPAFLSALLTPLAGCGKTEPPQLPPPVVEVAPVLQQDVPIYREWIGTLDGFVNAEIRPQLEGYLLRQTYKEGSIVHKGQTLFEIDPRQFQANYDQAKAALAQYEATLANAKTTVARFRPLAAEKAISEQELDDAVTRERTAQANVESAQAALENAKLALSWTKVDSPIDGIAGIAKSQVGDLVSRLTVMTTVSQVDPIKVYFNPSEQEYLSWVRQHGPITRLTDTGKPREEGNLELILADGSVYPHRGSGYLAGRDVDVKTGTIQLAGIFPNPDDVLRPGQYGKVRVSMDVLKGALVVPQRAVSELQGVFQIALLGPDNKIEIKAVQTGPRVGSLWVIEQGLHAGDRIVVEGVQKVRPGMEVNPKAVEIESASGAEPPATTEPGN